MNASRIITTLSITLLLSYQPNAFCMKPSAWAAKSKSADLTSTNRTTATVTQQQAQPTIVTQQNSPSQTPPASPEQPKTATPIVAEKTTPAAIAQPQTPPTPTIAQKAPASPVTTQPEATQIEQSSPAQTRQETKQAVVKSETLNISDLIKKQRRPNVETDTAWGSTLGFNTSYIPKALKGLKGLKDSKAGDGINNDLSRITHNCDWAVNEIAGQIISISDNYPTKDQYTLRAIIDQAKPYMANLREIVDLVNETNIQLIDVKLRKIQDTFDYFNTLCGSYATLAISEINTILYENKSRKKSVYSLITRKSAEDELSSDEYSDTTDLNDKIDSTLLALTQAAATQNK